MPINDLDKRRAATRVRLARLRARNPGYSTRKNAEWKAANRAKYLAHKKVEYAVKVGKLVAKPCERCGAKAQAHHEDYSRPLDVTWLCASHHRARHREMRCEAA